MQKRKSAFNIIDALIILLVIAVGLGVYFLFFRQNSEAIDDAISETVRVKYVLQVNEVPVEYIDNIQIGDTVVDYGAKAGAGEVVSVDSEEYFYVGHDKTTGQQKLTPVKDLCNLFITVEGDASMKNELYYINDTAVYVGRKLEMILPGLYDTGTCVRVDIVE